MQLLTRDHKTASTTISMSFREEFRLKKFFFRGVATERFCVLLWRSPGLLYVIYRVVLAVYTIVWLSLTAHSYIAPEGPISDGSQSNSTFYGQEWSAYLTNWTYVLLTIYFTLHALVALIIYILCRGAGLRLTHRRRVEDHKKLFYEIQVTTHGYEEIHGEGAQSSVTIEQSNGIPWYLALVWILFNAVSVGAIMVTIVFWAILVPGSNLGILSNENLQLHLVNTILVLIEHAVTAIPVRVLHVIYPISYGLIYMFFSLFYWVADHSHVMYFILDWNKPGPTIGFIILVGFLIMPIIHLIIYGIYRLKMFFFQKLYRE